MPISEPIKVLITGSRGFIGKNLVCKLKEFSFFEIYEFTKKNKFSELPSLLNNIDIVVHLAGENRPTNPQLFEEINVNFTENLCKIITDLKKDIPIIFASSTQSSFDNLYGKSKLIAEKIIQNFVNKTNNSSIIYRFPGVFGKWSRPNYNSVVATFCYNIANDKPIEVRDKNTNLELIYIDDLINEVIDKLQKMPKGLTFCEVKPIYKISLGNLAKKIYSFKNCRKNLTIENVGNGITRALYSTFLSFLPEEKFAYELPVYEDKRGNFVELLKTKKNGQFSFFTIQPGETRGSHYHHSKTEKFVTVKGITKMKCRNLQTDKYIEIILNGNNPKVVDTIPGWVHEISNIGKNEAIVILWANEVYNRKQPDTISARV